MNEPFSDEKLTKNAHSVPKKGLMAFYMRGYGSFFFFSIAFLRFLPYKAKSEIRGRSQTTFTDFWPFLTLLPPWLTALLNNICHIYLVTLTFEEPPSPHGCKRSL